MKIEYYNWCLLTEVLADEKENSTKHNYTITVTAVDVDDIKDRITKYIDVYTVSTDAHPDNIAKAMKNIYSDEYPDRDVIKITIEKV